MVPPTPPARPTDAELAILQVLWDRGPSTVREVHERLGERQKTAYTTALKLLQIMLEKGLVVRDESSRAHVYRAAVAREATQRGLVGDLLERGFGGSAETLVLRALEAKRSSPEELERIRELLDRLREREQGEG